MVGICVISGICTIIIILKILLKNMKISCVLFLKYKTILVLFSIFNSKNDFVIQMLKRWDEKLKVLCSNLYKSRILPCNRQDEPKTKKRK